MDGWRTAVLVVVAWGGTAFGGLHQMAEYVAMITFSDANWDVPPGTGYLTAVGLILAGALTLAYAVRLPRSAHRPDPAESTLVDHPA